MARILLTADPEIPVPPTLYGGIERVVHGLACGLRARGHIVGLMAHQESTSPVHERFRWRSNSSMGLANGLKNCAALTAAVGGFKPDLIHSFSRLGYLLPLLPRHRLPKIMSYQRHTGGRQISLANRLAGGSLVFTGCSGFIARLGARAGGRWEGIPNFVDTDFFTSNEALPPSAPLVFLSRLERIKGVHTAIAIARGAKRQLIIAGNKVTNSEGTEYWEREIAPFLGKDGIEYIGAVDDPAKRDLLGKASAMLVPIEWDEPFGIVFAESLACGTPVISCPRGALPEIVDSGTHGFLINSVQEGVEAVNKLGSIKRTECRRRAVERFSSGVVIDAYERLYGELIPDAR